MTAEAGPIFYQVILRQIGDEDSFRLRLLLLDLAQLLRLFVSGTTSVVDLCADVVFVVISFGIRQIFDIGEAAKSERTLAKLDIYGLRTRHNAMRYISC